MKRPLDELLLCNKVEKILHQVVQDNMYYETTICKEWLLSTTCKDLVEKEVTVICQSYKYLYHDFLRELKEKNIPIHPGFSGNSSAVEYFGYLTMYWMFIEPEITGEQIVEDYDISEILTQCDILHTLSAKAAIREIKENFKKATVILDRAFH